MLQINRIKKRFLIKLMRMLGFGGMAAYCMASCTTSNSQSNTNQSEVQANANQSEMVDSTTAQPDKHQDNSNPPTEIKTVESADNNADPTEKKLSDDELDKLLEQYHYKKMKNYSTRITKKDDMASFIFIEAESKTGNKITFPDTFKAIVQGSNGDYYAVFSDGTIDSIPNYFFYDSKHCNNEHGCHRPILVPISSVYQDRNRKPIGE